jgi:hypothetical protein
MSLLDVDSIDYVGVNNLFKRVYVGIFDDLDWDDEATHFALLTKKIDRYTQYIRSGQLLTAYPVVRGYPVVFEYVAMRPMTRSAEAFWKTREALIRSVGYGVRCRTVDVRHALASDTLVDTPVSATATAIGPVAGAFAAVCSGWRARGATSRRHCAWRSTLGPGDAQEDVGRTLRARERRHKNINETKSANGAKTEIKTRNKNGEAYRDFAVLFCLNKSGSTRARAVLPAASRRSDTSLAAANAPSRRASPRGRLRE